MKRSFSRLLWGMGLLTIWCVPSFAQAPSPNGLSNQGSSAVVLMYHRFGEAALPSTSIRVQQLEDHIAALKAGGHSVLPVADVVAGFTGDSALPDRAIAITVDDAYQSFLTEGWPRFKAAGFPLTLFVATQGVDAGYSDLLTWDDIRALKADGVTIGAHSHSHGHYPSMSAEEVAQDLEMMARSFQRELGDVPALFAFPYGEAGLADVAAVESAGFSAAFGQHSGAGGPLANPFYLPRFALNESYGGTDRFRLIIDTVPLPVSRITPEEPVLKTNPPVVTLTLAELPANIAALTCFGPNGSAMETAIDANEAWLTPSQSFPNGRARLNCTLPARAPGLAGRWHWFGWQMIVGFESEGVAVHRRYR